MSSQTPVLVRCIGSGEYCWQDGTTQGSGDAVALAAALGARSFWLAADSQAVRLLETPRPHPRRHPHPRTPNPPTTRAPSRC